MTKNFKVHVHVALSALEVEKCERLMEFHGVKNLHRLLRLLIDEEDFRINKGE